MPDSAHVIELVAHLRRARESYKRMIESGFDRGNQANVEIRKSTMDEDGKNAASVWIDFMDGLHEANLAAEKYDD